MRGAQRAVADRATGSFDGAFLGPVAGAGAREGEPDSGVPDDRDEPGAVTVLMIGEPVGEVAGAAQPV